MVDLTKETARPSWADRVLTHRIAFPALALTVSTLGLIPVFLHLNLDVGWFLYVAGRIRDGATMYVDVVDVNQPLIAWLSLVPVLVADALVSPRS